MLLSLRGLAPVGGVDGEAAMKRGMGYRKVNYAVYVNRNMPSDGGPGSSRNERKCIIY
jgi:hypothetical protein